MRVIKKINNNVAVCIDSHGKEMIALGKGIGFREMPYTLHDLSLINKTFYSFKSSYIPLLKEIDEELLTDIEYIMQVIRKKIDKEINDSLYFVLADHISFAISRAQQNLFFQFSIADEVSQMYEEEIAVGKWVIDYINKKYEIHLLKDEAAIIAIHIVGNYDDANYTKKIKDEEEIIGFISHLIEEEMHIQLDKTSFNYSRFATHLSYLLKRQSKKNEIASSNHQLFIEMQHLFPKVYACTLKIRKYLMNRLHTVINNEELLYLMIHINRMIDREDCNH